MKKKSYLEQTMKVVKLQQQTQLLAGSTTGDVSATMDGTFVEEDLAPEFGFESVFF